MEVRAAPPEHYGWIASRASLVIGSSFRAIEAVDDTGRILGMVGYDAWTPNSCAIHVALDEPIAARSLRRSAFAYPFLQLGKGIVYGAVLSTNSKAIKLNRRLGFRKIACFKDAFQVGVDLIVFEMRRENCRWLKE